LARQYLDALLRGDRRTACELVLNAVGQGTSAKDVYLQLFQPTQHEIGRLWQMNRITVAQEHYCTAATQLIMSQLYPHVFATERIGRRLVATCVGDELHELGVRMVADLFELEGWDTYYLGANAPADTILQAVEAQRVDVLAISATMTFHVREVAALIDRVRRHEASRDVTILVGGYPFNVAPGLWQEVGADGYARDAEQAVMLAQRLVGGTA
jgi:methanogenic corrinoid protein MtbC1